MKKKVLVLYSEFGNGHLAVAKALKEGLVQQVYLHNGKKEQNPQTTKLIEKIYLDFFTKNASNILISNLYGFLFWSGNKIPPIVHYAIQKTGYKAVNKLIKQYKPDLIICTYPYKIKTNLPIITIITDYGFANSWKSNPNETYFVTDNNVKLDLIKKGIKKDKIYITGIPVNKTFDLCNNNSKITTILFNLGARGQYQTSRLIKCLENLKEKDLQIQVICGKNHKLYNKLLTLYNNQENLKIYPFVTNMEELIAQSDLVITKAGGISITECIQAQKPMIINKNQSLKGQEEFNVKFIHKNKLGLVTKEQTMFQTIEQVCSNNLLYNELKTNIINLKQQYQTQNYQELIKELLDKENIWVIISWFLKLKTLKAP
ncbi:MAG: MGDG synthase family glycosyltransferase [Mycoplasmatales bacterium]